MTAIPFGSEFTVGIEEELLLVDRASLALAPMTDDVLDAMRVDARAAGHDAYSAQIELRSPPARSVADASPSGATSVPSARRLRTSGRRPSATPCPSSAARITWS